MEKEYHTVKLWGSSSNVAMVLREKIDFLVIFLVVEIFVASMSMACI